MGAPCFDAFAPFILGDALNTDPWIHTDVPAVAAGLLERLMEELNVPLETVVKR